MSDSSPAGQNPEKKSTPQLGSVSDTNLLVQSRTMPKSQSGSSADSAPIEGFPYEAGGPYECDDADLKGKLADEGVDEEQLRTPPTGGFFSSSVNLLKTIIGAGMLSLPFAFSLVGILPGAFLLFLATAMSIFGLYLLAKASYQTCNRDGSFAALSAVTYPRLAPVFDLAVALKCLGVAIGYLKIIGDLLPETIKGFTSSEGWYLNRILWVSAIVACISPVTFMKRIDSLKYTSFLGLLSVAYLLVLSVVTWIQTFMSTGKLFGYGQLVTKLTPSSFRAFPIMVFAFCCHQNLFPIQNEAKKNAPGPMLRIINFCLFTSLLVYLLFATGSYAAYSDETINPNIINNYPTKGIQFILARFLYIFLLTFSYPIIMYPTRESIFNIIQYFAPAFYATHARKIFFSTVVAILAFTWLIACVNPPLDFVLGLIGSTAAPVICFFLPAVFWLKIDPSPTKSSPLRIGCLGLIIFAIFSTILSLASLVLSMVLK